MHIAIPDVFRAINTMDLYHEEFRPKNFYSGLIGQGYGRTSDSIACASARASARSTCPSTC